MFCWFHVKLLGFHRRKDLRMDFSKTKKMKQRWSNDKPRPFCIPFTYCMLYTVENLLLDQFFEEKTNFGNWMDNIGSISICLSCMRRILVQVSCSLAQSTKCIPCLFVCLLLFDTKSIWLNGSCCVCAFSVNGRCRSAHRRRLLHHAFVWVCWNSAKSNIPSPQDTLFDRKSFTPIYFILFSNFIQTHKPAASIPTVHSATSAKIGQCRPEPQCFIWVQNACSQHDDHLQFLHVFQSLCFF